MDVPPRLDSKLVPRDYCYYCLPCYPFYPYLCNSPQKERPLLLNAAFRCTVFSTRVSPLPATALPFERFLYCVSTLLAQVGLQWSRTSWRSIAVCVCVCVCCVYKQAEEWICILWNCFLPIRAPLRLKSLFLLSTEGRRIVKPGRNSGFCRAVWRTLCILYSFLCVIDCTPNSTLVIVTWDQYTFIRFNNADRNITTTNMSVVSVIHRPVSYLNKRQNSGKCPDLLQLY